MRNRATEKEKEKGVQIKKERKRERTFEKEKRGYRDRQIKKGRREAVIDLESDGREER